MLHTQDVAVFARQNHQEFRLLVSSICYDYGVYCVDDVIQRLYLKFLTKGTLKKFNPNYKNSPKLSTYLYQVILNFVKSVRLKEAREHNRSVDIDREELHSGFSETVAATWEPSHGDGIVFNGRLDPDYETVVNRNSDSDHPDGLRFDMDMFERWLEKRNRFFNLDRSRGRTLKTERMNLLEIFRLTRSGTTASSIARIYGCSNTYIMMLKAELKRLMTRYGFMLRSGK
jgi:hypothetical protein